MWFNLIIQIYMFKMLLVVTDMSMLQRNDDPIQFCNVMYVLPPLFPLLFHLHMIFMG